MRFLALFVILVAGLALQADEPRAELPKQLVEQLGSAKYAERQSAMRELDKLGEASLPALLKAIRSDDLEIRRRASLLVQRIEERIELRRLLAGKRVKLHYDKTPLAEAVKDFAERSGVPFTLAGMLPNSEGEDRALADQTVTLMTGDVLFWDAVTLFCKAAKLAEPPGINLPALGKGPSQPVPCCIVGAVRVRALPLSPRRNGFVLAANGDGSLAWHGLTAVRVDEVIDDLGQKPTALPIDVSPVKEGVIWDAATGLTVETGEQPSSVVIEFNPAPKPAAAIKQVRGVLTVQSQGLQTLVIVDAISKAKGAKQSFGHGSSLTVSDLQRDGDTLTIRVQIDGWSGGGKAVRVRPGLVAMNGIQEAKKAELILEDANGRHFARLSNEPSLHAREEGGLYVQLCITFQVKRGGPEPARMILRGPAAVAVEVPFVLRDVPLTAPK